MNFWPIKKNKTFKLFLLLLVILAIAIACFFYFKNRSEKNSTVVQRPNVILISVDSLRADHVSANGYGRQTTPNIDALAKDGVLFKNYITQSYITPVSEMSLHTGMYPSLNNLIAFDTVSSKNVLTLAEILKLYGYRNAAFGNSPEFISYPALKDSFDRGFDLYDFGMQREKFIDQKSIFDFATPNPNKPFFLWLALGSAHYPYGKFPENFSDPNYAGPLKSQTLDWFNGIFPWIYKNTLFESNDGEITKKTQLNQSDIQYVIDKYDGDILATDAWIGDFLKRLKSEGLDKNTIIILQSEHGEDLNEHNYIHHYDIFDTMVKTPLIIKNPALPQKDVVVEDQVQTINILPTILDFLNIPMPHQVQGVSLVPLLENNTKISANDFIFIERTPLWERTFLFGPTLDPKVPELGKYMDAAKSKILSFYKDADLQSIKNDESLGQRDVAVRTNDWKLIYRLSKDFQDKYSWWNILSGEKQSIAPFELYNLKSDPNETKNVIDQYPDIASPLKEKLMNFVKETEGKNVPEIKKPIYDYF